MIAHDIGPDPQPLDDLPAMLRPLPALENLVPGTRYINVLACCQPGPVRQGEPRRTPLESTTIDLAP